MFLILNKCSSLQKNLRFVAAIENGCNVIVPDIGRYRLLITFAHLYINIEQTTNYGQAITLLERAYIKPQNEIMVRRQHEPNCLGKTSKHFPSLTGQRLQLRGCRHLHAPAKYDSRYIYQKLRICEYSSIIA